MGDAPSFAIYLHPLRVWAFRRWVIHRSKPFHFRFRFKLPRIPKPLSTQIEIVGAEYRGPSGKADPVWVAHRVRGLVAKDGRTLYFRVANGLIGPDPDPGRPKQLSITYHYKGRKREVVFNEGELVKLP